MANKETILQNQNEDALKLLVADIRKKLDVIRLGGGQKNIDKLHAKGKLSARERVDLLVDKDSPVIEIGAFAGYEMYPEHGGCPAGGVVVVMAYVAKRLCIVVANDATVKSGAWFPISGKKNLRAQEIAMENHLPIIYLVDSAGVYLPMQDEIFADKEHFGRIFRNNAVMSSKGIPQISAVMGACVAGGAYLPIMSDEALIVEETGSIFLAGPFLVKAAVGENIDAETLGGATTHSVVSGVTDYKMKNDEECLSQIRRLVDKMGKQGNAGFDRKDAKAPGRAADEILQLFPADGKPYNMKDIIECMVDADSFDEYKEHYGKTIMTGYARIDGWAVGIVANNRIIVKNGKGEVQMGGVIYSDSADKAARFIMNCNQKNIPLVFLQDVTGFMVGSRSEHGGIIKDGAKLVNAMANSVVPKFTVVVGNSYGAGNYAMCGKAYDPRLIVAWPTAKIAVMGGEQAAKTLLQIQVGAMKSKGQEISPAEEKELLDKITAKYQAQTKATYAASRLWVDAIIDPRETRQWLSMGIEAAFNNPEIKRYNVGVLQT
ncbi:MAG: acyl-CoA carboxylase subunit beta [Chitinophagales bacterium]|nr:acyl-CoA carboxylase subunit beta [Chitinophagales bacterium]